MRIGAKNSPIVLCRPPTPVLWTDPFAPQGEPPADKCVCAHSQEGVAIEIVRRAIHRRLLPQYFHRSLFSKAMIWHASRRSPYLHKPCQHMYIACPNLQSDTRQSEGTALQFQIAMRQMRRGAWRPTAAIVSALRTLWGGFSSKMEKDTADCRALYHNNEYHRRKWEAVFQKAKATENSGSFGRGA